MKKISLLTISTAIVSGGYAQPSQPADSPNLVIIIADQWRGETLGLWGIEPVLTPNIDALASQGIVFSEAISSYPVSSPARGMLMTGMYPFKNKVVCNCNSDSAPYGVELEESVVCWSDVLKTKGYNLGYLGKWHLDSPYKPYIKTSNNGKMAWNEWCPPERRHGFDMWTAYGTYDNHLKPMYWTKDLEREEFFYVDQWGPEYEADRAIEYIDKNKTDNFALVVSMNPPHSPYSYVPEKYKDIYDDVDVEELCSKKPSIPAKGTKWGDHYRRNIKDYYACMTGVDEQVGRIVNELKEKGLFDNTIIVFTSDHGDCIGTHGEITKNNWFEESMNIPMIITYPEKIKPRVDKVAQMSIQDIYPTVLSLMGLEKDIPKSVETINYADYIVGETSKSAKWQPYMKLDYKNMKSGLRGIRSLKYTFVLKYNGGEIIDTILYDNIKDPFQMSNIADKSARLCKELTKQTAKLFKPMGDPIFNN